MNKLLISLLTMLLALGLTCSLAEKEAVIYTCGDFEYILLEDGTAEITRYHGDAEALEIPAEMDGYLITAIGYHAFSWHSSLISISIPDSVIAIHNAAFSGAALKNFTAPASQRLIKDAPPISAMV